MPSPFRFLAAAAAGALFACPAAAQNYLAKPQAIGGNPGPAHNYVCPNADGGPALDCFLDAVRHLYTMCKHVKSIEIIEHGYENAEKGVNGAKSEYCIDKQKVNISRPYQAALREATVSKQAVDGVRGLHEAWLDALAKLKWQPPETDDQYKVRTAAVYTVFDERIDAIRTVVTTVRGRTTAPAQAKGAGEKAPR